jgi:RNA ligase
MTSWHSYPKVWGLGHAAISELLFDPVIIEEKIDGSQFSFGKFQGEIKMRSKGQEMIPGKEKMFSKAEETVMRIADRLNEGWTYRTEYLQKPKHNVLAYDRTPENHIIIFDINPSEETYLPYDQKLHEARRLGLECVPQLYYGNVKNAEELTSLLERTSYLGGQKIEGFVIKNYAKFGPDKKALMGKHVSEAFKEKHKVDWKLSNPAQSDIIELIINAYRTGARWDKGIIHLKEKGLLENSAKDIGLLLKEVNLDILAECEAEMKEQLWKWAWPKVSRGLVRGLPEYYKEKLLKSQFEEK